jgi:hypothetical protein
MCFKENFRELFGVQREATLIYAIVCLSVSEIIIVCKADRACTVGCCIPEAYDLVHFNSK